MRYRSGVLTKSRCKIFMRFFGGKTKAMDIIQEKVPREIVGRNIRVIFRMQFQAAAYAALEILSGKEGDPRLLRLARRLCRA